MKREIENVTDETGRGGTAKRRLSPSLEENVLYFKTELGGSFDILYRRTEIGGNAAVFVMADGMCNNLQVVLQVVSPVLSSSKMPKTAQEQLSYIRDRVSTGIDQTQTCDLDEAILSVLSGLVVLMIDGGDFALCFGVQGYPKRSIEDSKTEVQEQGAYEAFIESLKDNAALIRRRIRSPVLKFDILELGKTSRTRICVCYMSDRVSPKLVEKVKARLKAAELDIVLGSGYAAPFLDKGNGSIFSGVGTTERPDVACAEMGEGRVVVLTDGTPFALIVPYLFVENFQSMDDYNFRPYYAVFIRALRIVSFLISVFLPGFYVAICTFHQEVLPVTLLYDMAVQESITPFPVALEALFIHFVYEIVREAGLRMPKTSGQAVSIVGALIIGDAAVKADLIAAPMLIVLALTAISSFVVSQIYRPVSVLRFVFMLIGGLTGFYGMVLGFGVLLVDMCAVSPFAVPYMSSIAPFSPGTLRDTLLRLGWRTLGKREFSISKMKR